MLSPHSNSANPRLILASSSIYRQALLSRLRLPFQVVIPEIEECAYPQEAPVATAKRLASEKARVVAHGQSNCLVIGSDQVAVLDGVHIGKPGSHEKAFVQLQQMRGQTVIFYTAVSLCDNRATTTEPGLIEQLAVVETVVTFRNLPDAELDAYLRIEQPYDCAGSAKNEGLGIALIQSCQSNDPTALTGLPMIALCNMLRKSGVMFFMSGDSFISSDS